MKERVFKTTAISVRIWGLALLINLTIAAIYITLTFGLQAVLFVPVILFFPVFYSIPGVIIFWFIFLIFYRNRFLFVLSILTGLLMAIFSFKLAVTKLFVDGYGLSITELNWFKKFAIAAVLFSVVFHKKFISDITKPHKKDDKMICEFL